MIAGGDDIEAALRVADRELYRRLEERRNKIVDDAILKALAERPRDHLTDVLKEVYGGPHSTREINDILKDIYAVRGEPSREHTLVFHGTPDEFALFKARLCEWARKRIST